MFGAKHRPHTGGEPSMNLATMIERPRYDLTIFKIHFGLLTVKAYTKGEHVLRFEAITHNTNTAPAAGNQNFKYVPLEKVLGDQ